MKSLIISDVHSNIEAMGSVFADAEQRGGFDEVWSLGDLVGYGPDPAAVIDLLMKYPHRAIAGNHDLACVGKLSLEAFNPYAAAANRWTSAELDEERKSCLREQPLTLEIDEFTLAHGSPRDPIWEYVVSVQSARASFNHFDTYRCLVGHSHIPFVCRQDSRVGPMFASPEFGVSLRLDDKRLIINPGSVGQPRDGDPRAAYAVYDSEGECETITHHRVEYDIAATQDKMRRHGLPDALIHRLERGQ